MNWSKYVDHIYGIMSPCDNSNYIEELKRVGIYSDKIFSVFNYTVDNKFINYKYFKDIAVIEVIKDAANNGYNSIMIIRDEVKFNNNIERELNKCTDYIFSILNKNDICEDVVLLKKPVITYIAELFSKNIKIESYFDDEVDLVSDQYSVTKWNIKMFDKISNNFKFNKVNICSHTIDFVISYVNSEDEEWQKLYKKAKNSGESFNNVNRWRDFGFLEYNIMLLNKYVKWINTIYIIVSQPSQVPTWVKKYKNIQIVYHNDYIPEKALPTFNSCTIESYLFNIPNLSEYFIYSNDDTFCINQIVPTDFFEYGKIKTNIVNLGEVNTNHLQICKNSFKLLLNDFTNEYFTEINLDKQFKRLTHIPHPMLKSTGIHVYSIFKRQIDKAATKFRTNNNINQYVFVLYDYLQENIIINKLVATYCELSNVDKIKKTLSATDIKLTCINDTKVDYVNQDKLVKDIKLAFEQKISE